MSLSFLTWCVPSGVSVCFLTTFKLDQWASNGGLESGYQNKQWVCVGKCKGDYGMSRA